MILLSALAFAGTLAGVTLPDTASVGGSTVNLNGIGLREKYFLDIYVGGLYLTTKTHDGNTAINADEPKKIVMHFIYKEVTNAQIAETFGEQMEKNPSVKAQSANFTTIESWMPASVHSGDEVAFEYVPGTGVTVKVNNSTKGTVPGADFMKALWTIYLGANPPTADLKSGMLGS